LSGCSAPSTTKPPTRHDHHTTTPVRETGGRSSIRQIYGAPGRAFRPCSARIVGVRSQAWEEEPVGGWR
jgi:hypothetical protein